MAYSPISQVSISLQTSGVTRQGFGVPIFLSSGNFFFGKTASYADLPAVGEVFPTHTNVYKAAQAIFSQPRAVTEFKVGKLSGDSDFTPDINDANGDEIIGRVVSITVTDDDNLTVTASHTVALNDTPTIVATALKGLIDAGGLNVTVTDDLAGTITISSAAEFSTTGIQNLTFAASAAPATANDLITDFNAIRDYDDAFYAVMYEGRTKALIEGLAANVEALEKIFATCVAELDSINDADTQTATDTLASLYRFGYNRTIGNWHHAAATSYPEAGLLGFNLPFISGAVTWNAIQVAGFEAAQNPANGRLLTATQRNNLEARNVNWLDSKGGITHNRNGKVMPGEWIDVIRGRDNLESDLTADLDDLLLNQTGTKIPYTDAGIAQVATVVENRLNIYVTKHQFILSDFRINVPKAADIARADKVARQLVDLTFTATLQGAIHTVQITGTISI